MTSAATGVVGPLHTLSVGTAGPRIAFLHGLFGQGRNWTQAGKALARTSPSAVRCTSPSAAAKARARSNRSFSQ